jgi:hypothetical protein
MGGSDVDADVSLIVGLIHRERVARDGALRIVE